MSVRDIVAAPRTSYAALAVLVLATLAFWPPFFSKLPTAPEIYVNLHAAAVIAWMALLVAQPVLIRLRRRPLHRKLGAVSFVLVPVILVTAVLLAHSRLDPVSAPTFRVDATDMYLAMIAIALFAVCYALAMAHRKNAALHARFMTATLLTLIDPILFRLLFFYTPAKSVAPMLPIVGYGVTDLILLGLVFADRKRPWAGKAFPLLLAIFVPAHLGYFTFARTDAWVSAMAWFRGLPLG